MKNLCQALTRSIAFWLLTAPVHADIVVIVPLKTNVNSLTQGEARQIFMGKSKRLPDGQSVVPLVPMENHPVRIAFDRLVLDRDPKQMRAYWAQMIFTGRGKPPQQLENDAAMKREVAATPNAIGYIDQASLDGSIKAIMTIKTE